MVEINLVPRNAGTRGTTRPTSRGTESSRTINGTVNGNGQLRQGQIDGTASTRFGSRVLGAPQQAVADALRRNDTMTAERPEPQPSIAQPVDPEVQRQQRLRALAKSQSGSLLCYNRELAAAMKDIDDREAAYNKANPSNGFGGLFGKKASREAADGFERNRMMTKVELDGELAARNKSLAERSKDPHTNPEVLERWAEGKFFKNEFFNPLSDR